MRMGFTAPPEYMTMLHFSQALSLPSVIKFLFSVASCLIFMVDVAVSFLLSLHEERKKNDKARGVFQIQAGSERQ